MTAAQFEDQEGRDLVEAIHRRKAVKGKLREQLAKSAPSMTPEQVDQLMTMASDFGKKLRFDYNQPLPPQPNYRPREWETTTKETP